MSNTSRTDWYRIDAMTDDDIDTDDIPPLSNEFFAKAKLRLPSSSLKKVTIDVDADTKSVVPITGRSSRTAYGGCITNLCRGTQIN